MKKEKLFPQLIRRMDMKVFKYIIIVILLIPGTLLFGQTSKTGTTAAQVLKMNVGPRAIGMGGAFTATSDDITAIYWNPSGLADIEASEAIFNHNKLYMDVAYDFAGFSTHLSGVGTIGVFVSVLSMDEMLVRTVANPEGTGELFDAGAMVIGLSYAKALTSNFSIGFNAKYITESIYNMNATGFAVDIGTLYRIPVLNELRIASSISNFGTKMKLEGRDILSIVRSGAGNDNLINSNLEVDAFELPLLFRFGIAVDVIQSESQRLTAAVDAIHPNDHSESVNSGLEYGWNETFFVRAGYNALFEDFSEKGLTLGAGINYRLADFLRLKFDYAYQDYGRLNDVHYFSVGVKF
jgi:hypothetical protein